MSATPHRILLLDTGKEWGGGTNSMLELLKRIDRSRFAVEALFYRDYAQGRARRVSEVLRDIGIPLRLLESPVEPAWAWIAKETARGLLSLHRPSSRAATLAIDRRWRIEPMARRIASLVRDGGYDLLYLNNQPSSNLEGILAARYSGVPCIQHCRIEAALTPYEVRQANQGLAGIICVSDGVRAHLVRSGIRPSLCEVVHNGIDVAQALPPPAFAREELGIADAAVVIAAVGSLIARKRLDVVIDAFALLQRDSQVASHLVIAGEGALLGTLQAQVSRLGLADKVSFLGFVENGLGVSRACDIAVLASAKEGLPRVLLEAMWLGKPVIASDVVGPRELVVDGDTGWLFPLGDARALARHLSTLVADADLRNRMGRAARARIEQGFSIGRYVDGVQAVWLRTLRSGRHLAAG